MFFSDYSLLTDIRYIENSGFFECSSLANITISNGVEKINSNTFCERLNL